MTNSKIKLLGLACLIPLALSSNPAAAVPILGPDFTADYTLLDLGSVAGLPVEYGGMVFKAGDPNKILIGGNANIAEGGLYQVPVVRDLSGHIIGVGAATQVGAAPFNDGGFAYGPGGVLFLSQWPENLLSQYKSGNLLAPDKVVDMAALGVADAHASLNFVPAGFAGAGQLKANSWEGGEWYTLTFAADGLGTFNITAAVQETTLGGGPEGFVFISGANPDFGVDSLLIDEWSAGNVAVYDLDGSGNPLPASRRDFITGLDGAEGAAIDPLTGDFVFSTFGGGDRIVVVKGFTEVPPPVPEPSSIALLGTALAILRLVRRRKRA